MIVNIKYEIKMIVNTKYEIKIVKGQLCVLPSTYISLSNCAPDTRKLKNFKLVTKGKLT